MRNFLRLAAGVDIGPLALALATRGELWGAYGVRGWHSQSVHKPIEDIVLRYNKFDGREGGDDFVEAVCANLDVENYPAWGLLPEATDLLWPLMQRVKGQQMGRVFISRMRPGQIIPPHSDRIAPVEEAFPWRVPPAAFYERYHIVVATGPGVMFRCGDEQAEMLPGEIWWFDNEVEHEVVNNSAEDRVHLVCDIHSPQEPYIPPMAKPPAQAPALGDLA